MLPDEQAAFNNFSNVHFVIYLVAGIKGLRQEKMSHPEVATLHHEIERRAGKTIEMNAVAWMDWLLEIDSYTIKQKKALCALRKKLSKNNPDSPYTQIYDVMAAFR